MQRRNVQQVQFSFSATGNNTVIANPSKTAFMAIWGFSAVISAASNITFFNGPNALSGAQAMQIDGSYSFQDNGHQPIFLIDPGQSFIVNQSGTAQIGGWVTYSN
jgi:hypothetical protein